MNKPGDILFVSRAAERFFSDPVEIVATGKIGEVRPCLNRIAKAVEGGLHAAGFLCYEAAPAFDPAFKTHPPGPLPLLWFGLYRQMRESAADPIETDLCRTDSPQGTYPSTVPGAFEIGPWSAIVFPDQYRANVRRIRRFIKDGETYQVNYTFPMRSSFHGDTPAWFRQLCAAQRANYSAFINLGAYRILCASPELFFRLNGNRLEARPMKGTRPRGRWSEEDAQIAASLAASEKDRAENIMIVDLLRNDMGKISKPGSVRVRDLYAVEQYPTVWQMTSTILSHTNASVSDIIAALFPCGSVTGAPKVRTMEIIREVEPHPRGAYCGAIGWWAPRRRAEFSVAIRTVTVDTETNRAFYHVGGGITADSSAEDEYRECLAKSAILARVEPEFELIESLRFDGSYFLLDEHIERLRGSASYFGFKTEPAKIMRALAEKARELRRDAGTKKTAQKVRLLLRRNGSFRIESAPIQPIPRVRLGFAADPVDSQNIFLYHKTTRRSVYERALASRPDCDDVLLWNQHGEITESTIANIVLELEGKLATPPISSGLLPGTFRQRLLRRCAIMEQVLTKNDVARAESIRLANSVRKWINVQWVEAPRQSGG